MRPKTAWLVGLALGGLLGMAYLVVPLTLYLGLAVLAWLLTRPQRLPPLAGVLTGFGALWLLLIGRASWACSNDPTCGQQSVLPWIAIGAVILGLGLALAPATLRQDAAAGRGQS